MTPAPTVIVNSGSNAPSSAPPTTTGTWFAVGLAEKGSTTEAIAIRSFPQAVTKLGARVAYGVLYDSLQTFFKEGGSLAYVSRVVGPAAKAATVKAVDGSAAETLSLSAANPGEWGNNLSVVISQPSGSHFQLVVKLSGETKETSPVFATNAEAVAWALNSSYIRLADLGGATPAAATKTLISGTDDRANITETHWTNALPLFLRHLGPGQVSMPGRTTATAQTNLLAHAKEKNRIAILDGENTATSASLVTQATTLRALANARYGGLYAPWAIVPADPTTTGTVVRTVPYSAVQAGLTARSDGSSRNPNLAVAGDERGVARYAIGLSQAPWTAAERDTLSEAGVNVARYLNGAVRTWDNVTLVNNLGDTTWLQLSNARLAMALNADAESIAEGHLFNQITSHEIADFGADLAGMLLGYFALGALGDPINDQPEDAYSVNVGPQVNTTETIGKGELHAVLGVKMSPSAEIIELEIVKEAI